MTDSRFRSAQDIDQTPSRLEARAHNIKIPDTNASYASATHFDSSIPRTSHSLPFRDEPKDNSVVLHPWSKLHTSQPLPGRIDSGFVPSFMLAKCPPVLPPHTASALYNPMSANNGGHIDLKDESSARDSIWVDRSTVGLSAIPHQRSSSSYMETSGTDTDMVTCLEPRETDSEHQSIVSEDHINPVTTAAAAGSRCLYRSYDRYSDPLSATAVRSPPSCHPSAEAENEAAWSAAVYTNLTGINVHQAFTGFEPVPVVQGYQQGNLSSGTPPQLRHFLPGSSPPFMPSICPDRNSPAALRQSNLVMGRLVLPGLSGLFRNVCCTSNLFKLACLWGFSAISVSLGSSYFQRIIASLPKLQSVAADCPESLPYAASKFYSTGPVQAVTNPAFLMNMRLAGQTAAAVSGRPQQCGKCGTVGCSQLRLLGQQQDCTLAVIQATCMVLAAKVVDRPPSCSVLRDILQNLYHCSNVTPDQAYEVEARCLEALQWRLGPYYCEDPLTNESRMC